MSSSYNNNQQAQSAFAAQEQQYGGAEPQGYAGARGSGVGQQDPTLAAGSHGGFANAGEGAVSGQQGFAGHQQGTQSQTGQYNPSHGTGVIGTGAEPRAAEHEQHHHQHGENDPQRKHSPISDLKSRIPHDSNLHSLDGVGGGYGAGVAGKHDGLPFIKHKDTDSHDPTLEQQHQHHHEAGQHQAAGHQHGGGVGAGLGAGAGAGAGAGVAQGHGHGASSATAPGHQTGGHQHAGGVGAGLGAGAGAGAEAGLAQGYGHGTSSTTATPGHEHGPTITHPISTDNTSSTNDRSPTVDPSSTNVSSSHSASQSQAAPHKPSLLDKAIGATEIAVGKVTKDTSMIEEGQARKTGVQTHNSAALGKEGSHAYGVEGEGDRRRDEAPRGAAGFGGAPGSSAH